MRITIVGGGNIGTQFAVHCAEKGHEVTILSSNPGIFEKHLYIVDENENITHEADIYRVTNESSVAYTNADIILVTVPANIIKSFADNIYKYASENCIIGVVPGNGGSECAFHQCIKRGNIFFLMERVPAIARLVKKGQIVKSTGYRKELHIASLPSNRAKKCCDLIQEIFDIPCVEIPCLLNMTLTPSNPLLHTSRLRSIFADYKDGIVYDKVPAFYEEWDRGSLSKVEVTGSRAFTSETASGDTIVIYAVSLNIALIDGSSAGEYLFIDYQLYDADTYSAACAQIGEAASSVYDDL